MARVCRTRTIRVAELSAGERARLEGPLVAIVMEWFQQLDRKWVAERVVFRDPDALLRVMYGPNDEVLGYATVSVTRTEVDGAHHSIFDAGVYLKAGTRGGDLQAVRLGLRAVLSHKLRHPGDAMCYVGAVTTPASYRFLWDACPVLFPREGVETPRFAQTIMLEVSESWGYVVVNPAPLVVRMPTPVPLVRPEQLTGSRRIAGSPEATWFIRKNPDCAAGNWLLVYIPLDNLHLVRTMMRFFRRRLLPSVARDVTRRIAPGRSGSGRRSP